MRSTFAGLNTMVRGIMANQMSLDTTGHNITNAGTEGYSRQTVTLATTYSEERGSLHGTVRVGTGVDALSVERARDVYADIQYRNENPTQQYYYTKSINYDKLETIFDDSKNLGVEEAINKFYRSWVDLSTTASTSSSRVNVIEQGRNLSDIIQTVTSELQDQIRSEYDDIRSEVLQVDQLLEDILQLNREVLSQEVTGASANDLRDRRDLLVDKLSNYVNVNVTELEGGAYQINSGGVTLVNGVSRAHLAMGDGVSSSWYGVDYGVTDYNIKIVESNIVYLPQNGSLKARFDAIAENKTYIDRMADIANFLLSTFNEQNKQGWDIDGHSKVNDDGDLVPDTINFYGRENVTYQYRYDVENDKNYLYKNDTDLPESERLLSGVRIIAELEVNSRFNEIEGDRYIAAATSKQYVETAPGVGTWENLEWGDRTGDGTNAVYMSELFNIPFDTILSENRASADVLRANCILRNLDGNTINEAGTVVTDPANYVYTTSLTKLSINSFYQKSVSSLGLDAYSTDVNYEAMQAIMTQVTNWRDSTSGVDWNEELTNMIKFQKGFASCSRCLNAMDECLDRLVNSTGVVGR
ncbi:MAG: flagellar hook-associated protein FlgK [Quinella sp. 2Q5]|nr:flagellar hook-associated protein FlgK [Quinella sp. 2Q5]